MHSRPIRARSSQNNQRSSAINTNEEMANDNAIKASYNSLGRKWAERNDVTIVSVGTSSDETIFMSEISRGSAN